MSKHNSLTILLAVIAIAFLGASFDAAAKFRGGGGGGHRSAPRSTPPRAAPSQPRRNNTTTTTTRRSYDNSSATNSMMLTMLAVILLTDSAGATVVDKSKCPEPGYLEQQIGSDDTVTREEIESKNKINELCAQP